MTTVTEDRDAIVLDNLGLVRKMAYKYINRVADNAIDFDDLYGEGCVGLIKATEMFDPTKGYKFSTFACTYISGYILRSIRRKGFVSVSHHIVNVASKIMKNRLEDADPVEIAKRLRYSLKIVETALQYLEMRAVSMDIQIKDGEGDALDNFIHHYEDYSTVFVQDFIRTLKPLNRQVIEMVMAGKQYREIGNELGYSFQAVGNRVVRMRKYLTAYQAAGYGEA